jgi:hypothetical protein
MMKSYGALSLIFGAACALSAQQSSMPGMNMPPQQSVPKQAQPAKPAAGSEQNPTGQQTRQGTAKPGAGSDFTSISVPVQELQEPEAIGFHTGQDLPAPELLKEVLGPSQ